MYLTFIICMYAVKLVLFKKFKELIILIRSQTVLKNGNPKSHAVNVKILNVHQ